jgi:hypothetical protein
MLYTKYPIDLGTLPAQTWLNTTWSRLAKEFVSNEFHGAGSNFRCDRHRGIADVVRIAVFFQQKTALTVSRPQSQLRQMRSASESQHPITS